MFSKSGLTVTRWMWASTTLVSSKLKPRIDLHFKVQRVQHRFSSSSRVWCHYFDETECWSIAQIPLGLSRHVSAQLYAFDVSSPCILALSSLSNRQLDTFFSTRRTCRVASRRDVTSQVDLGLCCWCICWLEVPTTLKCVMTWESHSHLMIRLRHRPRRSVTLHLLPAWVVYDIISDLEI